MLMSAQVWADQPCGTSLKELSNNGGQSARRFVGTWHKGDSNSLKATFTWDKKFTIQNTDFLVCASGNKLTATAANNPNLKATITYKQGVVIVKGTSWLSMANGKWYTPEAFAAMRQAAEDAGQPTSVAF